MIRFKETIEVEKPVDRVFSFVSNLENSPRWNDSVVNTKKMSPGPIQDGTVFRQYRNELATAGEAVAITSHARPQRLSIQSRLADSPAQVTYEFEEVDSGTRIISEVELEPAGVMRLIAPIVETRVRHSVAEDLAALKRVLEEAA
jgi:uncharacterized membrane protein